MDFKKYLQRINYEGSINTSASTLKELCDCHTKNVPFDTLDIFGGVKKVLSLEKIYKDIVENKRGGFCYENNGLFYWLLKEFGFKVDMLQAQAYVSAKKEFNPEFDHMCLMVTCDKGDKWLTDVGWGGTSFFLPLKFVDMEEQSRPNGNYRLRKKDDTSDQMYFVEKVTKFVIGGKKKHNERAKLKDWEMVYQFHLKPRQFNDFDEMCVYQQESDSSFLKRNAITGIQNQSGATISWGQAFCKKKYIDPYTEEITSAEVVQSEAEFKEKIQKEMGIAVNFPLSLKNEDFTGFAEEQGCCRYTDEEKS